MTRTLRCLHGHQFDVAASADQEVICPFCGTITSLDRKVSERKRRKGQKKGDAAADGDEPVAPTLPVEQRASDIDDAIPESANEGSASLHSDRTVHGGKTNHNGLNSPSTHSHSTHIGNDGQAVTENMRGVQPTVRTLSSSSDSNSSSNYEDQSSIMKTVDGKIRTTTPMTTVVEQTEPPNLPGYRIISELGRGGMGVVYRAYDEKLKREVALKTLQRIGPFELQRFKQEFRALADVSHPNIAGLYDLLSDGKTWCFTMEMLEAVNLLEFIWSNFEVLKREKTKDQLVENPGEGPRLSLGIMHRLYDGLKQLALGLNALHEAGVLHRDIKPSNILVTTEGRVVLLDFGLAGGVEADGQWQGILGTPKYMAPEQAACLPLSPATDWYAVGVMLYELLTGRLPIDGKTLELIEKKQTEIPTEPRVLEPSIPTELNELCKSLLDIDASRRPKVFDVLRCIGAEDVAEELQIKTADRKNQPFELVGRESHLATLQSSFEKVKAGTTRSIFVSGKSGMGKSVLIQTFLDEITKGKQAVVLTGRCYEQESVPFKALDSLIDSLVDYLNRLPKAFAREVIPEDSLPLVRLFPVMGRAPGAADAGKPVIDNADEAELRQRAMNALRELLKRLGQRSPVVLYIDDLQWGDEDSAYLLANLVRPPDSPRVMMLGSFRSENINTSQCLKSLDIAYQTGQHLPHRDQLAVESLSEEDAARLATMLLGDNGESTTAYASKIARESGGWPFFVWELAQHIQDDPEIADQALTLDEVIWARANRLPKQSRRMLELVAVAGRPIQVTEIYQALDAMEQGQNLLVQLRTSNFIRATESAEGAVIEAYHDRIRESITAHLSDRVIKDYNLRLAETIQRESGIAVENVWAYLGSEHPFEEPTELYALEVNQWQRVFDMAYFFDAADESGRALPYAVIAAEKARQQNSLEVAEQQFRIALRSVAASSPALRFRVLEGLGDVLILRGQYDEANKLLKTAKELVKEKENSTVARIDCKLGTSHFKKGNMDDASEYLEKALSILGKSPPTNFLSFSLAIAKEGVAQVLHTWLPSLFVGRRNLDGPKAGTDLFRAKIYYDLTFVYWFSRGMNRVLWSHLRGMNLAERYRDSKELGQTYAFHAVTMTGIPMAKRGIKYSERSYKIAQDQGYLWGQGQARSMHAFACIVLARFQEGVDTGSEAVELLEQAGDVWEANMARMIATVPRFHLGDLKTTYTEAKKAYEIAVECGDYSGVCISLLFWVPCAPHLVPKGAIQKELERKREDPLTIAGAVYARGLELLLCEDKPREAAEVLTDCLARAKKRGLRNVCIFSAVTWKATALRIVAERETDAGARKRALIDAGKAVKAALKITRQYLASRPHALREAGIIATLNDNEAKSRRYFEESLRLAEEYSAKYDHAKTLLAQGISGKQFGWPDADQQITQANAIIADLEDMSEE